MHCVNFVINCQCKQFIVSNLYISIKIMNPNYYQKLTEMVREKLKFSSDKRARNAWCVYQPSGQTGLLQSECGRTVYSEAFEFGEHQQVESLKMIALKLILKRYSGGAVSNTIQLSDHVWFGENLNISMPIEDIVLLDVSSFSLSLLQSY